MRIIVKTVACCILFQMICLVILELLSMYGITLWNKVRIPQTMNRIYEARRKVSAIVLFLFSIMILPPWQPVHGTNSQLFYSNVYKCTSFNQSGAHEFTQRRFTGHPLKDSQRRVRKGNAQEQQQDEWARVGGGVKIKTGLRHANLPQQGQC